MMSACANISALQHFLGYWSDHQAFYLDTGSSPPVDEAALERRHRLVRSRATSPPIVPGFVTIENPLPTFVAIEARLSVGLLVM
jgi:hypothetical protein